MAAHFVDLNSTPSTQDFSEMVTTLDQLAKDLTTLYNRTALIVHQNLGTRLCVRMQKVQTEAEWTAVFDDSVKKAFVGIAPCLFQALTC